MKRTRINPISKKQLLKNHEWENTTIQKAIMVGMACQWCGRPLFAGTWSGHHIRKRRYNDHSIGNCFVVHTLIYIEGRGVNCHDEADKANLEYPDQNKVGVKYQ